MRVREAGPRRRRVRSRRRAALQGPEAGPGRREVRPPGATAHRQTGRVCLCLSLSLSLSWYDVSELQKRGAGNRTK